ncbi:MAG: alpha/beta hydrolase [Actinomycetota bacterium]|nr:alpha/beta hydrolase [Actinomycetota bacterium]
MSSPSRAARRQPEDLSVLCHRPSPLLFATEPSRAVLELGLTAALRPLLANTPGGDGHPVIVLPGFTAADNSTLYLRHFLRRRGYFVHGWRLGINLGPTDRILKGLQERFAAVSKQHGRKCSLVGWSLGGIFAREIARTQPEHVRQVITLGSPFQLIRLRDTNAAPLYWMMSLRHSPTAPTVRDLRHGRPPLEVPSTAVYTRGDGVVSWQACQDGQGPHHESIEVLGSHCGLGHNPTVLRVVADRLALPEDGWKPYPRSTLASCLRDKSFLGRR